MSEPCEVCGEPATHVFAHTVEVEPPGSFRQHSIVSRHHRCGKHADPATFTPADWPVPINTVPPIDIETTAHAKPKA